MRWLRNKLRTWLGITSVDTRCLSVQEKAQRLEQLYADLVSIGVDVHFKEPHMILVYSRLKGGQIREIRADFDNMQDLDRFVAELRVRFNTKAVTYDLPDRLRRFY